ncbi:MAG: peptidoglycan DD-metalloendopeptidase family protein [Smithella sp.]|nr:peptidoglycan DD-metalloendopeptidase family protein [Smithella sp.]
MKSINNTIENGETLFSIFTKYGLRTEELFEMKSAAASIHPLRNIKPGTFYTFILDEQNSISSFSYGINEDTILKIERVDGSFQASKYSLPYETRVLTIGGSIRENLVSAFGTEREDYLLALQAADILAWDIDFNTDLRSGDTFRIIVEGLYLKEGFKKYGKILSIEFINNKQAYNAYLFDHDGKNGYYNAEGQSLRRAFLKAPLSFRRISSHFSRSRMHPILKVRRPHHGIDYAAATGTPVSTVADGTVTFAGYRGGYGKLIIISHRNGYQTYYGHLSRFAGGMRKGKRVQQGDLIGYVGATGQATGPHLHYEMRQSGAPINPLRIKNVASDPIPAGQMTEFKTLANSINKIYDVAVFYDTRNEERKNHYLQPALLAALSGYNGQKDTSPKNN